MGSYKRAVFKIRSEHAHKAENTPKYKHTETTYTFTHTARDEKIRGSLTFAQLQETIREIDGSASIPRAAASPSLSCLFVHTRAVWLRRSPNRLAALRKTLTVSSPRRRSELEGAN